jgi:hypothetical protein
VNTRNLTGTLTTLLSELVDGAPSTGCYMLNRADPGLLRSLGRLSAAAASAATPGGASIAAHVDHIRYSLWLMNRWAAGEELWRDADWTASWRRTSVSDAEWQRLRSELRDEAERWLEVMRTPREVAERELNGMVASIAHLAYHLGAIRQIDRAARGPSAEEERALKGLKT